MDVSLYAHVSSSVFGDVDWIVSMPKLKTHHWAGVTLSMKNLFGVMPGPLLWLAEECLASSRYS